MMTLNTVDNLKVDFLVPHSVYLLVFKDEQLC